MKGVLVINHGSRSKSANDDFYLLIDKLNNKSSIKFFGAHLSLSTPTPDEVVKDMYKDGYKEITIIPYFLSNGSHVSKDIPLFVEEIKKKYTDIHLDLKGSLAFDDFIVDGLLKKIDL